MVLTNDRFISFICRCIKCQCCFSRINFLVIENYFLHKFMVSKNAILEESSITLPIIDSWQGVNFQGNPDVVEALKRTTIGCS